MSAYPRPCLSFLVFHGLLVYMLLTLCLKAHCICCTLGLFYYEQQIQQGAVEANKSRALFAGILTPSFILKSETGQRQQYLRGKLCKDVSTVHFFQPMCCLSLQLLTFFPWLQDIETSYVSFQCFYHVSCFGFMQNILLCFMVFIFCHFDVFVFTYTARIQILNSTCLLCFPVFFLPLSESNQTVLLKYITEGL